MEVKNEDSLPYLKSLSDNSVDLILTEPPYQVVGEPKEDLIEWERTRPEYLKEIFRVSKNQIIWGWRHIFVPYPEGGIIKWGDYEAYSSFGDLRVEGKLKEKLHPYEIPLEISKQLIEKYTKRGDLVVDPFCGAGGVLLAAKQLGRRYVGIEATNKYYLISKARLQDCDSFWHTKRRGLARLFSKG